MHSQNNLQSTLDYASSVGYIFCLIVLIYAVMQCRGRLQNRIRQQLSGIIESSFINQE